MDKINTSKYRWQLRVEEASLTSEPEVQEARLRKIAAAIKPAGLVPLWANVEITFRTPPPRPPFESYE
jgi:hypothetical protein